jgi:hypothetical protein
VGSTVWLWDQKTRCSPFRAIYLLEYADLDIMFNLVFENVEVDTRHWKGFHVIWLGIWLELDVIRISNPLAKCAIQE